MRIFFVVAVAVLLCGCGQTPKAGVARNKPEAGFLANPCCPTTYNFVEWDPRRAVPVILRKLDQLPGETNVARRCDVIQGALWEAEHCTNRCFTAIIKQGQRDPSAAVRAKTESMVERGLKELHAVKPPSGAGADDADGAQ